MLYLRLLTIFVAFCLVTQLSADTSITVFKKYPNPVFIETGSFMGDGIYKALAAGFTEIHSVELSPDYYNHCVKRFRNNPEVHLYLGDSAIVLPQILSSLTSKATFWLDGHYSTGKTAKGEFNSPILLELAAIKEHPIKDHTLLIDDVREFGTERFDYITLEEITQAILEINPTYCLSFERGVVKNDVLVAEVSALP